MKPRPESWTVHATQKQKKKCYRASYPFIDFVWNSSRDLGEVNDLRSLGNRQDEHREPATAERNRGYRGPLSSFHNRCDRLNPNVEGLLMSAFLSGSRLYLSMACSRATAVKCAASM